MIRKNTGKNPYELWKGRPANVNHFRVFGSKLLALDQVLGALGHI
jgi:hypothetical protein